MHPTRWFLAPLAALALQACVILPPPPQRAPLSPAITAESTTLSTHVVCCIANYPDVAATLLVPAGDRNAFDLGAGLTYSTVSVSPGVWFLNRSDHEGDPGFGVRVGLDAGAGDLAGWAPYRFPWLGPAVHMQLGSSFSRGNALMFSLGGAYTTFVGTVASSSANVYRSALWLDADLRIELLQDNPVGLAIGTGFDISPTLGLVLPALSLGPVFHFNG